MSLKFSLMNNKLNGMDHEFNDAVWYEFHGGGINNQDDFYEFFHQWIDNEVIYTSENEAILEGNSEYCFEEHDVFGRPNNVAQAAYAVLYDYLMDSPDTVTFDEMEELLNEE